MNFKVLSLLLIPFTSFASSTFLGCVGTGQEYIDSVLIHSGVIEVALDYSEESISVMSAQIDRKYHYIGPGTPKDNGLPKFIQRDQYSPDGFSEFIWVEEKDFEYSFLLKEDLSLLTLRIEKKQSPSAIQTILGTLICKKGVVYKAPSYFK